MVDLCEVSFHEVKFVRIWKKSIRTVLVRSLCMRSSWSMVATLRSEDCSILRTFLA